MELIHNKEFNQISTSNKFYIFDLSPELAIMKDTVAILKDLKKLLVINLGKNIDEVILFGSYAMKQSKKDSDIDILIILKSDYDYAYKRKIRDLCYEISLKYDVLIDSKIISLRELKSSEGKHPIYQDAINQGIYA